jgi:hypothetical protein
VRSRSRGSTGSLSGARTAKTAFSISPTRPYEAVSGKIQVGDAAERLCDEVLNRFGCQSRASRTRETPQRDVDRFAHTCRSEMILTVAAMTSAHSATFDIVSIVPSMSMAWTTLPTTMTTARTI